MPVKYLIAISGPVASGKSVLANELLKRFKTHRISTRQLLADTGAPNERNALIEAGKRLDRETGAGGCRSQTVPAGAGKIGRRARRGPVWQRGQG